MALTLFAVGFIIFAAFWNQGNSSTVKNLSEFNTEKYENVIPAFNYEKNGTDWPGICETGDRQSPIFLDGKFATRIVGDDYQPIFLVNYNVSGFKVIRDSNGFFIVPDKIPRRYKVGVAGGNLRGFYKFVAGYFHWPAEHLYFMPGETDNLTRYSLEIHLLHIREDFKTFAEAVQSLDGEAIAILAGIYGVGAKNPSLTKVQASRGDRVDDYSLRSLLPDLKAFFRYKGSLTHPPCSENVVWTVFTQINNADQEQIDWFHDFQLAHGHRVSFTNRKYSSVGTRDLYLYLSSPKSQKLTCHFIVFFLILWMLK